MKFEIEARELDTYNGRQLAVGFAYAILRMLDDDQLQGIGYWIDSRINSPGGEPEYDERRHEPNGHRPEVGDGYGRIDNLNERGRKILDARPISDLDGITPRIRNAFRAYHSARRDGEPPLLSVLDLMAWRGSELVRRVPNFGRRSLEDVQAALAAVGLALRADFLASDGRRE